ncbi:site-specific DNA-methyltransferase [Spirochaetia bacterium]|nr:site-specific DNA-methyltransferase [Spirochaetia bacterium]
MAKTTPKKTIAVYPHTGDKRKNIPPAEFQAMVDDETKKPIPVPYPRNTDLDPQLVWKGKDEQNQGDLVVQAPALYIQEKVHPKVIIDDIIRHSEEGRKSEESHPQIDLFSDFNGIPEGADKTEFYRHDQNWTNRMILGDSLKVMSSLAEREDLKGKVQCIYLDPPYGIKFNSNFQWSTTSRDVKDGNRDHITREPEQVKAFRDTWRYGIHSYLSYLRDRLTVARELLTDSGSIFVQIGDENVHRVRDVMDEVFGEDNFVSLISIQTTTGFATNFLGNMSDFLLWYGKKKDNTKFRDPYYAKEQNPYEGTNRWLLFEDYSSRGISKKEQHGDNETFQKAKIYNPDNIISQGRSNDKQPFAYHGIVYDTWNKNSHWKANYPVGMDRLNKAGRIHVAENSIRYIRFITDFQLGTYGNIWTDTVTGSFTDDKIYVVQTNTKIIQRCILMTTDPGDLVLDPTCGSGTTAYVAEQWGRRWITIDTSRVALALARSRIMGARYPYYLLADSPEGRQKEAELTDTVPDTQPTYNRLRQGFVYERVPHITLKAIANNAEIDVIYDKWQTKVAAALKELNLALRSEKIIVTIEAGARKGRTINFGAPAGKTETLPSGEVVSCDELLEWEVPGTSGGKDFKQAAKPLAEFWDAVLSRQKEIDASIAAKAEFEYLYDKPYDDKRKIRVAGPFTVESISPHRVLNVDENDMLIDSSQEAKLTKMRNGLYAAESAPSYAAEKDFTGIILENLKSSGVQQSHKDEKIEFSSLTPWPGKLICARALYTEGKFAADKTETGKERKAAIFIGEEFGTVTRADLVEAANEAAESGFDVLIACAFNYEARTTEFNKLGKINILKARMNADLHMADDLRNTGKGNLFVIFGEPDIEIVPAQNNQIRVHIKGVDVFHPTLGKVISDNADGIACWFIDTDYNEESFFVRHAYFLGANDPYDGLKKTLKAEIDQDAWATLKSDTSRPFDKPASGRIAVKVINHLGDEVMKIFKV